MVKKIGFYVFIVASLTLACWGYFRLKESKEPNTSVLEHIPTNAICVIETKTCSELVAQLTRQNLIWNSLLSNSSLQVAQNGIRYLDSLVNANKDISEVVSGNSLYWSFVKKDQLTESIISFKVKEKSNDGLFSDFFGKVFAKDPSVSSFEAYYFNNNKQKWLVCYHEGLVYVSSDLGLLQDCIELDKEQSLAANKNYQSLLKENGDQNTQVYFNHFGTNLLSRSLFTRQSLFGLDVKLNEITLTGYSNSDSLSFFNCLKNQGSENMTDFESLPDNPDIIQGIVLSNVNGFYELLKNQQSDEKNELIDFAWNALNDSALYNLKQEIFENIDKEIFAANYVLENITSKILSLKIKDEEKTTALLKFMSDSIYNFGGKLTYKLHKNYRQLFSFTTSEIENEYALIYENHLVFFSNKQILNYYQAAMLSNHTLGKNKSFMDYAEDNLGLDCNYMYYENAELMKAHNLNSVINSEELWMSENATSQLSLTAKNFKNVMQVRFNVNHAQPKTDLNESSNSLWTFKTDSVINTKVHLFLNHLTQENELCFQDVEKNVHLINSTGNSIWKKKINEAIQSEIYTVDIFKNGKLQMLFNTTNYLHLIDRNGNDVQGFPVKLPAKVTSNITVLDYEGNKDYRLFIACADKRIYNFNLYGVKTEGFMPVKTLAEVTLPINYVSVGPSDYLITADVNGNLYAFSRKGEGRIDFKNKTISNLNHLYIQAGNNLENTKLIYVDDKNNLMNKITLSDKKEALKIGDELSDFQSSFSLINDDSQMDVLVYGSGALYAYDLFTSQLMECFNELAVYKDAQSVQTTNNQWVIAFDATGQKVDIISTDGKLSGSIPNVTKKPFVVDLYKNGRMYLLLVNGNKVSCQELN
jgi:hypothetical protein